MPFVDAQGQSIYYEVTGQGPAIVLIHSLGSSSHAWREQVKALSPRFTVVTFDVRGHGRSPHQKEVTIDGVVQDLEALVAHLGLTAHHLLGISMGAIFSLSYYRRNAPRVRSLILADSFATLGQAGEERVAAAEARWAAGIDMAAFGREYTADCLLPSTPRQHHEELAAAISRVPAQAYLETMRAIFRADVTDVLPTVQVPTLVIVGDRDHRTPPHLSEAMAAGIPGARLVRIPEADHLSNLDNPAAFNAAVLDFLNAIPA